MYAKIYCKITFINNKIHQNVAKDLNYNTRPYFSKSVWEESLLLFFYLNAME